jgi:hypothetical protein
VPKDSLQTMLDFLAMLREKGIHYQLDQSSPDSIMAFFTVVGGRVEVDFHVGGIRYRTFTGHEDVLDDEKVLLDLIKTSATRITPP